MRNKLHQFVIVMENPGSRLCFVSSFRPAWGCVEAHSSVFSGISFHLCAHSHVGIVLVLWSYVCWMSVGQNYVFVDGDFMWLNIWFPPSGSKDLEFAWTRTRLLDLRRVKKTWYFTFCFVFLSFAGSFSKIFQCGTGTQTYSFISALQHLAESLLIFKEMEKDVQRCENKPRRPNEYSAHSSLTLRWVYPWPVCKAAWITISTYRMNLSLYPDPKAQRHRAVSVRMRPGGASHHNDTHWKMMRPGSRLQAHMWATQRQRGRCQFDAFSLHR